MPASNAYESSSLYQPIRGRRSFDDSEPYMMGKQTAKARAPDNTLKSLPADKEKSSSVAKIKVVVCRLAYLNLSCMFHFTCFVYFPF